MPYYFVENFQVADERGQSRQIDIECNSSLSHAHARISQDGQYQLLLNGNRHFLNTPLLRNFTLTASFSLQYYHQEFGNGFVLFFRQNRRLQAGHALKCAWDEKLRLQISIDQQTFHQDDAGTADLDKLQIRLTIRENQGIFELNGKTYPFLCPPEDQENMSGEIGFDALFSPGATCKVSSLELHSPDLLPRRALGKPLQFRLRSRQAFSEPLKYTVELFQYEDGRVELEYTLDGTIRGRGKRIETGGGEWCYEIDKLRSPYLRLESGNREIAQLLLANGELLLMDPCEGRICSKLFPRLEWPRKGKFLFRQFPEEFTLAAGYQWASHDPWRFAENGPYEMILNQDGELIYEGPSVRGNSVSTVFLSPPGKKICGRIPSGIPDYAGALRHAREQHYFYESEPLEFELQITCRQGCYDADEFRVNAQFNTVFSETCPGTTTITRMPDAKPAGCLIRQCWKIRLDKPLSCGVYHLHAKIDNGPDTFFDDDEIFEVLSDAPDGPCPPLASKLPVLLSMPNEIKYLESDAFDPYGEFSGYGHYYSVVNRYPAVGRAQRIWELLTVYRRRWWLQLSRRNTSNSDINDPENQELLRHAYYFELGCMEGDRKLRYDLFARHQYQGQVLTLLKQFLEQKKPPCRILTPSTLEQLAVSQQPLSMELFQDLFQNAWDDWCHFFHEQHASLLPELMNRVRKINPDIVFSSGGPYSIYVSHYKSPYTLKYGGLPLEKEEENRGRGGFFLLEDYHYSCDYPLSRAAYFVAGYDLHCSRSRMIFPEIYFASTAGCNDGAVYQAHPPHGLYDMPDSHQRRIVYQFTYGTPQFHEGAFKYWRDYGFHLRNPFKGCLKEFIHAWGKLIRNEPAEPLPTAFVMLDLQQIARHGDYLEDRHSFQINEKYAWSDVCNTAEEALGFSYELFCENGFNSPVLTDFPELDALTPEKCPVLILPPLVGNTPKQVLAAIRRAYERGINLLCFEQVHGLEDIFGVHLRPGGPIPVRELPGESFDHKCAVAHYENESGTVLLHGAENPGNAMDIPIVIHTAHKTQRTAFFNLPPTVIRRESFREKLSWGQDTLSRNIREAMRQAFEFLLPDPAATAEPGCWISACRSVNGDWIAAVSEASPIYGSTRKYPVSIRFQLKAPGIGDATIESDTLFRVLEKDRDFIRIRCHIDRDSAVFFRFSNGK